MLDYIRKSFFIGYLFKKNNIINIQFILKQKQKKTHQRERKSRSGLGFSLTVKWFFFIFHVQSCGRIGKKLSNPRIVSRKDERSIHVDIQTHAKLFALHICKLTHIYASIHRYTCPILLFHLLLYISFKHDASGLHFLMELKNKQKISLCLKLWQCYCIILLNWFLRLIFKINHKT